VWSIDLQLPSMFTWLENKKLMLNHNINKVYYYIPWSCNNSSLASTARIKSLLYFYLFKQQMPFLKELKQKAKLTRTYPKCNPGPQKVKNFWRRPPIPPRGLAPMLHLPQLVAACQDGGDSAPIFGPCYCINCPGYFKPNKNPEPSDNGGSFPSRALFSALYLWFMAILISLVVQGKLLLPTFMFVA